MSTCASFCQPSGEGQAILRSSTLQTLETSTIGELATWHTCIWMKSWVENLGCSYGSPKAMLNLKRFLQIIHLYRWLWREIHQVCVSGYPNLRILPCSYEKSGRLLITPNWILVLCLFVLTSKWLVLFSGLQFLSSHELFHSFHYKCAFNTTYPYLKPTFSQVLDLRNPKFLLPRPGEARISTNWFNPQWHLGWAVFWSCCVWGN